MSSASPASPQTPACPSCHATLLLGANGLTSFWSCPNGHGVACTMTAAYGHVQQDEILKIWHGSEKAAAGDRACPMCGNAMLEVAVDEAAGVKVDVCRADELFWLDAGELDQLPKDAPAAAPSAEQERNLEAVRQTFDAGLEADFRKEMSSPFNRLVDLVSGRHPAFAPMFSHPTEGQAAAPPDVSQSSDSLA
jgi:Zn-finger nucleic acid-binding protein